MAPCRWEVTVLLDSFLNLYHASNVVAGLSRLSADGLVDLTIEAPRDGKTSYSGSPLAILIAVSDSHLLMTRKFAVDLYDRSDLFCMKALCACDYYYKRSFHLFDIQQLPSELRGKVRPFGLNYACRYDAATVLRALARDYAIRLTRASLRGPKHLKSELQQLQVRGFLQSPPISKFEQSPPTAPVTQILFQTRLWASNEVGPGEDWEEINEHRVSVLRRLKRAFPQQFVGGVMPTEFSKQHYPDLLSPESSDRRDFIEWSRRCRLGVYTRGLHHSHGFKLSEYLASSKCIVADPLRNTLPVDLIEGTHFLRFRNPEECAAHCETLLCNSSYARSMQVANWNYYQAEVRPDIRMKRLLSEVFIHPVSAGDVVVVPDSRKL